MAAAKLAIKYYNSSDVSGMGFRYMQQKTKAFSLIELMVVIAVIAILAAVAVPSYKQYIITVSSLKGVNTIQNILNKAVIYREANGSWPTSFEYAGTVVPFGGQADFSNDPVFYQLGGSVSPDEFGIGLGGGVQGVSSVPGWNNPSAQYTQVVAAVRYINGVYVSACGLHGGGNDFYDVPLQYQPAGCTCQDVISFYITGTGC
jgi:prepilin-type N-terminal cleavage/methylation domain-containing protein